MMDKMEESQSCSFTPQKVMSFGNTPRRSNIVRQRIGTPLQNITETPEKDTKQQARAVINPFEVKADSLYFHSCSPSVFATFAKNKTDNGQFRWSIDHISFLYPADIDETSVPDVWVDPDQEAKAQKAIDAFFSQESIVPSPWSSDSKYKREERRTTRKGSFFHPTKDVGVQTKVTVPPNVDLLALLGEEFAYNEENDTAFSSPSSSNCSFRDLDVMSTSSLRRKLFAADEGCETPSRLERKDLHEVKQWSTPTLSMKSIQSTPSDLLASSPKTPPICSEYCSIRASPQMSPIAGPSQRSFRMRSFNERLDEESNSHLVNKPSAGENNAVTDNSMSFYMDSQDTGTFQSYASDIKQDTGYVTGSQFSLQNVTSDTTTGGFQSHITPVAELFDDCAMSNVGSNMSCLSENNNMSIDCENLKCKNTTIPTLFGYEKWSLEPNSCSTPTVNL